MRHPSSQHTFKRHGKRFSAKFLNALLVLFKKRKGADRKAFYINLILGVVAVGLFGLLFLLILMAWYAKDLPNPNQLSLRDIPQSTKIYDRTGEHLLYEVFNEQNRTLLPLQEDFCGDEKIETSPEGIPLVAIQAIVAMEDHKFCSHSGIRAKSIARAVLFGGSRGGGSTLTQQLVKNAILTNEKKISRKVKEILLSVMIERRYTKDEILRMYFNEIGYGSNYYGIETASQNYLDKHAWELSLDEAAMFAAMIQRPTYYSNNPDQLKIRRDRVLDNMLELGYVTEAEVTEAKTKEVALKRRAGNITAPHFVLWVKEQLETEYGQKLVEQGGLQVITSLDYDKQLVAQEVVTKNKETKGEAFGFNNAGLVAIDPNNGHILSMVGSADYFDDEIDGQVNVTLRALQPGSSMKPIIYAAGFERGYTPNTILWDAPTTFPSTTGPYNPQNFTRSEFGPVSIRKALQGSLNIPAVKMLALIGLEQGVSFAERFGYTTFSDRSRIGLSFVLGANNVIPLEHANTYATFANDGVQFEPVSILKVTDAKGEVLREWKEVEGKKIIEPNIARMVSNVLSDNAARQYIFGASSGLLTLPGRPVAAKTGTTNDNKDAWAAGYTPSLATVVWAGNTDGRAMKNSAGGGAVAMPIWNEYMRRALSGSPVESFIPPQIPTTGNQMIDGVLPSQQVEIDTVSGKLATEFTPAHMREVKVCGTYHNELHFINPSNPAGPALQNPENHPYYTNWEAGVQTYITEHNANLKEGEVPMETCEIPTEYDDVHVPQNTPDISIRSPRNGDNVARIVTLETRSSAPRGISRLEYAIDGLFIVTSQPTENFSFELPTWVTAGVHTLTVTAYDDVDNKNTDSVTISVTEGTGAVPPYTISNPFDNQIIESGGDPYTIVIESPQSGGVASVNLILTNHATGERTFLYQASEPAPIISVPWTPGAPGLYLLSTASYTSEGQRIDGSPIRIIVRERVQVPVPTPEETDQPPTE